MKKLLLGIVCCAALPGILAALEITLTAPTDGVTVPLLNTAQKAFLDLPRPERIAFFANAEKRQQLVNEAGYLPLPVFFAWKSDALAQAEFRVILSKSPDMTGTIAVPGKEGAAKIDNLRIGQIYYWQVEAVEPGAKPVRSAVRRFTTETHPPRLMRFPGVPNVRDLGGRPAMNGMRVKQSRIFRTAGMNTNARTLTAKNDEELFRKLPDYRVILPMYRELQKRFAADPQAIPVVPYALGNAWTVFKVDGKALKGEGVKTLESLAGIPETLFGVKGQVMAANKRGRLEIPMKAGASRTAVLMQEFTAPTDGIMQIASGGDNAWNLRINGKLVYSRIHGNGKPATTSNYHYFVPVRKGKNLAVVVLKAGAERWMWCCGKRKAQNPAANIDGTVKALLKTPIGWKVGVNRIAPEGRAFFLDHLGVKSDIDLRSSGECRGMTGSPLGKNVTWFHISSAAYAGMQTDGGKRAFAKVFKVFLDEKNYPVIFHCIAGQDRTGAVAFILNGLLGVEEEELYRDWETTGFWNKSVKFNHELRFNRLIDGFRKLPGKNLHEQIENYVISCGFTKEDIAHFRELMLEKQ